MSTTEQAATVYIMVVDSLNRGGLVGNRLHGDPCASLEVRAHPFHQNSQPDTKIDAA